MYFTPHYYAPDGRENTGMIFCV